MTKTKTKPKTKAKPKQRKVGRPSIYTPKLRDEICSRLAEGMSLRKICKSEDMPTTGTVCRWIAEDSEFSEQYAKAREAQAETMADEILDIADEVPPMNPVTGAYDSGAVNHTRLRIDARKWVAAKLLPKKYGDKVSMEHSGKIGLEDLITGASDEPASH